MKKIKLCLLALLSSTLLFGCKSASNKPKETDFSDVVVTRYSAKDNLFATDKEDFYSDFLVDSVDKKIALTKDEEKNAKKSWEKQIEGTKKALDSKLKLF